MQKILGGVGLLVLLAALAGGVYLSQKSQETRRGAAGGNGVVLFTPTEKNFRVGELLESTVILDVAGLGVSGATGLLGAEVNVAYDTNVVGYEGIEPLSGYELMFDKIADTRTGTNLSLVFTRTTAEPNGSVQLAKLKFRALRPGNVNLKVTGVFSVVRSATTELAKITVTEERNAVAGYVVLGDASPTVRPVVDCSRCSVLYDNQAAKWRAVDCTVFPGDEVVERIYDPVNCPLAPASTRRVNTCQRCSTVNQGQYVWWEISEGESCNRDPAPGAKIYRAEGVAMCLTTTPTVSVVPAKPIVLTIDCARKEAKGVIAGGLSNQRNLWLVIRDMVTGDKIIRTYVESWSDTLAVINTASGTLISIRTGQGYVSRMSLIADRHYEVSIYSAPFTTGIPTFGTPLAQGDLHYDCPTVGLTSTPIPTPTPTSITPTLTPTPTPTIAPLSCGGRCYGDADCASGYTCFPVGMDRCEGIAWPTVKKFTSGERLNTLEMADIKRRCPDSVAIVNNIVADPERMVGQCRKEECVTDKNCACTPRFGCTSDSGCESWERCDVARNVCLSNTCDIDADCPSDRRCINRVCLSKTVSEDIVSLSMSGVSQAVVGQPFVVTIKYNTGDLNKKVSGLKMTFKVPSGSFKILSNMVSDDFKGTGSSTLVTGDGMTSSVEFNLVSLKTFEELKSSGVAVEIKIMPLVTGVFVGSEDGAIRLFTTEVVGKTVSGGSISYPIGGEVNLPITVVSGPTISADICRFCPSGERLVGDANCDGAPSMLDFEVWRSAMFDKTPLSQRAMADMDCTGDVKMLDFEVWRSAFFDKVYAN
ncbi:MAG: hypothetical protein WCV93_01090 [Candidatus Shapirobacteria bacterium]|jgi:hypothetical protein